MKSDINKNIHVKYRLYFYNNFVFIPLTPFQIILHKYITKE